MAASGESGRDRFDQEMGSDDLHESEDDLFARRERGPRPPLGVSELVRRAIETTVGQVQNPSGLPKEAINYLLQQGDRGRREIVRIVAKEVGDFLRATDISSEVVKILTNVQLDFSAQIRFKRNPDGGLTPEITEGPPRDSAEGSSPAAADDPSPAGDHES